MSSVSTVSISDYLNSLTSSTRTTSETSSTTEDDGASISKDEFITLLMTQMQYQDPLNPMDSQALTSQLTDFSMLEQQIASNTLLEDMSETLGNLSQISMLDYIGKEVTTSSNTFTVDGENMTAINYSLDEAATVQMIVYDSEGEVVCRVDLGDMDAGSHALAWDGTDGSGEKVADGAYYYSFLATDGSGDNVTVDSSEQGEVTGITYVDGSPWLLIGDNAVSFDSLVEINGVES